MGGIQKFEQRLEQMISGAFAPDFRSAMQPIEIAAALQRECDNKAQILSRDRRLVPNDSHGELSATDLKRPSPHDTVMADELVAQVMLHAETQGYVFPGPVTLSFEPADDLTTGRFRRRSRAQAKVNGQLNLHPGTTRPGPARGQRHVPPPAAAEPRRGPQLRGQRPRRESASRRDLGACAPHRRARGGPGRGGRPGLGQRDTGRRPQGQALSAR